MWGLIQSLNLGEQLTGALVIAMAAWYLFRGKSMAGTVVRGFGTLATVAMGTLAVIALAIGLGWFDPQPGVALSHVATAVQAVARFVLNFPMELLEKVIP